MPLPSMKPGSPRDAARLGRAVKRGKSPRVKGLPLNPGLKRRASWSWGK